MYADISEPAQSIKTRLEAFMDQHIYPNEERYHEQFERGRQPFLPRFR